jgi:septation ring formation regulator EzrA
MAAEEAHLERMGRELKTIREMMSKVINYIADAESEIPEKMRRFISYMHDVHDVSYMYEERGVEVPSHIHREMERCDDRYRQLLVELLSDGGKFEQIRREMAKDSENRWDHTRLLTKPKKEGTT